MSEGYSAFLYNGDLTADRLITTALDRQQLQEQQFAWFNIVDPAYNASELFSELAGSTHADERNFKRQARGFHHAIFHFTAQPLFAEQRMTANYYLKQPRFHPAAMKSVTGHWIFNLALLFTGATGLWLMGWHRIQSNQCHSNE